MASSLPSASAAAPVNNNKNPSSSSSSHFKRSFLRLPSQEHHGASYRGPYRNGCMVHRAQLKDNSDLKSASKLEVPETKDEENPEPAKQPTRSSSVSEERISDFMAQVSSLVKLVDSRDIVELQLQQHDCELTIRKKEALPQPPAPAPVVMMNSPLAHAMAPSQMSIASPPAPAPAGPAAPAATSPALPPPAPKTGKSSHPPLKSPMAGTLYRCPGPGEPPFVKVGDKVKKGQVLCIIEAMKLMNEIEADHGGIIIEVLVDDGKSVSVDTPLFVIEP
ncbi:biotin carboxyl carrier protein of acetyl-CoA carboxylase, chloroplastic isoform X1 [Amborella trichopoda]|uniref:biotin carboxyl carrier protein of acetyl-CoA carboxylase, chloroplastic isoform X1 n=1 Tax=Amborella trichopoda TaxID=13333 RepID=UPI0005D2D55A|nr:biotin carboxyl carrier protein of acetyl-CoA carboxylase, chloroplastic isoform X1 [Amborella trichopoda]|eukprot:XP_011624494.1 biotin carboxyl carrier protein of acetyl-CoA carboxylase, chloroplastic isoform X1 [Amborella trichopoda]